MSKEYSKCNRLCIHMLCGTCTLRNRVELFGFNNDAPFYARYYIKRDTVNCKIFWFDSWYIPLCSDCKRNPIRHNSSEFCGRPHIISNIACKVYTRLWWKFKRPK